MSSEPSVEPADPAAAPPAVPARRIRGREIALVTLLAALLYIPYLGSYNLWDPWETHYGEVARRMQQDHDWVRMVWQNENFQSKPVLTFWLMSGSMQLFGVGKDGGYSGEFVASHKAEWALRLPFALFGVAGITALWYMIARLYNKRAAWMAAVILATCPYYFFISRQAITDMPSCAMLIGSIAFLALAIIPYGTGEPDTPLPRWKPRFLTETLRMKDGLTWFHGFLAIFALTVVPQLVYFTLNLGDTFWIFSPTARVRGSYVMIPFIVMFVGTVAWCWLKTTNTRQVYMYFFYLMNGVGVLAKGPIAPVLGGFTIIAYLVLTGEWRLLLKVEIPRGILIALVVCLPWHFAIFLKDGMPWIHEYVNEHLFNRAFKGVFQTPDMPGTFHFFFNQLGIGMWPWVGFMPAALVGFASMGRAKTVEDKVRLLIGIWAIIAFTFFSMIPTKFHHYILPAVPALATLIAFWFDDLLDGKVRYAALALGVSVAILVFTSLDLIPHQEKLVQLFCFRYDRPWPKMPPWNIDFARDILAFAILMGLAMVAIMVPRVRRWAVYGAGVVALAWTIFAIDVLLPAASPHWGQRTLHEVYYKKRAIHGVDLTYGGLRELWRDFGNPDKDFEVKSVIPETLHLGDPMTITWQAAGDRGAVGGTVSKMDPKGHRFWIAISPDERGKLSAILERAKTAKDAPARRWLAVNADRLIAWQLNWRGENFYSGGEIYNPRDKDMQTVYMDTDNKAVLEYLKAPARNGHGRKFWVITEKARLSGLPSILPTAYGKATCNCANPDYKQDKLPGTKGIAEDDSSNKFALGSFIMDEGQPLAPGAELIPEQAPPEQMKKESEPGIAP